MAAKKKAARASPKKSPKRATPKGKAKSPKNSAKKSAKKKPAAAAKGERRIVENVNVPGYRTSVDAAMYDAMHKTLMAGLPVGPPGMTQTEMFELAETKAPRSHFPGGAKAGWWMKTVQLDQEVKGTIVRSKTKPLRWWRTA
jgi:hypothetical protein